MIARGPLPLVAPSAVLARMAAAVGASDAHADGTIAGQRLRAHQRDALAQVRAHLRRHGGVLLADEVGLGKTLVCLAVLREARTPVVVAPAALRPMWTSALAAAGLAAPFVSVEALSRGRAPATRPDLVVVDEAHHARTPTTRRYAALAALTAGARTLLVSATPIHNRPADLAALLALFMGERAHERPLDELARHVVRHEHATADAPELPAVEAPRWIELPPEHDVLEALACLPAPVPAADGGDGGALVTYSLVRQWASSRGALRAALRRRLAAASAIGDALDAGRHPTRAQLEAWTHAGSSVQLAFPELVAEPAADGDHEGLRIAVRRHADAVRTLLRALADTADPDVARADALRDLRRRHPGARIVAFAEHAETVAALWSQLRRDAGVAALSGRGGVVAGGCCSRADLLTRFAPRAMNRREPAAAERVELLLATDLLSEGVSLHDASVVVHLDLPWSPARLEQRVGRVRRIGSAHARVHVYCLRAPAEAARLLAVEQRLRRKLAVAARAVGVAGAVLPPVAHGAPPGHAADPCGAGGDAEAWTRVRGRLASYAAATGADDEGGARPLRAVARADRAGLLALVLLDGEPRLVAAHGDAGCRLDDAPHAILRALDALLVGTLDAPPPACVRDDEALARAESRVLGWAAARGGAALAGLGGGLRSRRRVLERIAGIAARAERHRRAPLAPLLGEARRAAAAPLGVGAERVLDALAAAPLDDEPWLRALSTFGRLHAPGGALARDRSAAPRVAALLLLRP